MTTFFLLGLGLGFLSGIGVTAFVFWLIVKDENALRGTIDW